MLCVVFWSEVHAVLLLALCELPSAGEVDAEECGGRVYNNKSELIFNLGRKGKRG